METRLNMSNSGGAHKEEKSDNSVGREDSCRREASRDDALDSAKAEMSEVREENVRLKMVLEKLEKEYKSLQMRFTEISQQEVENNSNPANIHEAKEEPEFVSLRLGRSPSQPKKDEKASICSKTNEQFKDDLNLALDYNIGLTKSDLVNLKPASPENSSEETRKGEQGEAQPPSKVSKTLRSEDDEISQPSTVKRARVSVRARCDTPTMNDGCQWRKYGQKISKGNPCPRAYYRCTVAPACPVRKQVQRCVEDMSILITTYEGTHNHPLSVTATAMASTTAAAASMLLSGASTTQSGHESSATTSQTANLHGLNANLPDTGRIKPCYLPTTPSPAFPTITLDLTASGPSSHFNMFSSNFQSNPRFPSRNLSFSSSESNSISTIWGNRYNSFGNLVRPYQEHSYQPYIEKNHHVSSQQPLTDTLTKAITSDPSFQSVIAAAISSMVGASAATQVIHSGGESFDKSLKWSEATETVPSKPQALNGNGFAPSYLSQSSTSNSRSGSSIAFPQTSSPFSISRTTSTSVAETRDQAKF